MPPRSPTPRGPVWTEGEVNMPEAIPISTDKKCPACASTDVHEVDEVPANIGTRTQAPHVAHLWSCEKCRNAFRLVEAAGDPTAALNAWEQRDPAGWAKVSAWLAVKGVTIVRI